MALTKITTNIIADNAITSDKIAAGALDSQVSTYLTNNNFATQSYVSTELANLIDSSPEALNTLNELAAALGDDPNFATTVNNSIGTKWTQDNTKISNWDTAYGWGDHSSANYLVSNSTTSAFIEGAWAGTSGYPGYSFSGGNSRFGFSSSGGSIDVYTDGNFYATDNTHKVWHAGDFTISDYAPLSGATFTGTVRGYVNTSDATGDTSHPFQLGVDANSWMVSINTSGQDWGLFWAGNSGAAHGTNSAGGPGNIWSNSSNPNEFCFVSSLGTQWSVHGNTGNTWQKGSDYKNGGIYFNRGGNDFSTYIRAGNHPNEGYVSSNTKYWVELGSKGGTHIVLNTDGGSDASENAHDRFTIWQGSNTGRKVFEVSNRGRVDTELRYEIGGSPIIQIVEITPVVHEFSFSGSVNTSTTLPSGIPTNARYIYVDIFATATTSDHQNFVFGPSGLTATQNWVNTRGTQPSTQMSTSANARQATILTYHGEADNFTSNYGIWYPSQIVGCSGRTLYFNNYGNSGSSGWIYMVIKGYSK